MKLKNTRPLGWFIMLVGLIAFVIAVLTNLVNYHGDDLGTETPVYNVDRCLPYSAYIVNEKRASNCQVEPMLYVEQLTEVETVEHTALPEIDYYDVDLSHDNQDWIKTCIGMVGCDIDPSYIVAMIFQESRFDNTALGNSGDSGFCQILTKYFSYIQDMMKEDCPELYSLVDNNIWNERTNIAVGVFYLDKMALEMTGNKLSEDNIHIALTAYNRGASGARNLYQQTGTYQSNHSKAVVGYAKQLQTTNTIIE